MLRKKIAKVKIGRYGKNKTKALCEFKKSEVRL